MNSIKTHWENIYLTKNAEELSWTEPVPETSLHFINGLHLPKTAGIIDIGGGESKLADCLLDAGYTNVHTLDISVNAIDKAKIRLGQRADQIQWMAQDILEFRTDIHFDCWHDRAAFHFLTNPDEIAKYTAVARLHINRNGYLIIGSFSEQGPKSCSGLPVRQYNPESLCLAFSDGFQKMDCIFHDHETPSKRKQNFLYCLFRKT
jgi:2-polyprenyl-3-methyl-5-hydroxy-6-metoxy-1,4-benzoquinol methylase